MEVVFLLMEEKAVVFNINKIKIKKLLNVSICSYFIV